MVVRVVRAKEKRRKERRAGKKVYISFYTAKGSYVRILLEKVVILRQTRLVASTPYEKEGYNIIASTLSRRTLARTYVCIYYLLILEAIYYRYAIQRSILSTKYIIPTILARFKL